MMKQQADEMVISLQYQNRQTENKISSIRRLKKQLLD